MKNGRRRTAMLMLALTTLLGCAGPEVDPAPVEPAGPACPSFKPASEGLPITGEWRSHPGIGDVNGDGVNDLSALARKGDGPAVFLGDGLGNWTESFEGLKFTGSSFSCGIGTRLVDLDRDGHVDLLEADHCRGVRVFRGNGGESWVEASRGIPQNMAGFNDADAGDLDGDGILDIVAISALGRGFLVLGGRQDGGWELVSDSGLPATGMGFEIQLIDMSGDGRLDVVSTFTPMADLRNNPPPPAKVWIQDADGRFQPAGGFPDSGRFFGVATIPGEGSDRQGLIFALVGAQKGLYLYESDDGDHWSEAARIDEGWFDERFSGFIGVDTADVDGDGCVDLATTGGGRPGLWLAMGDCSGGWRLCPPQTLPMDKVPGAGWGVTIGDLNGDGRSDLVAAFGTEGKGGIKAWIQAGP